MTAIVSPEGRHLAPPLTEGEGMVVADLDLALIVKRKRMMDSVGHYARPELLSLTLDPRPARPLTFEPAPPAAEAPRLRRWRRAMNLPTEHLINELQTFGVRLADPRAGVESRRGGAGPSDHKALTIDGVTIMAPVHTAPAFESPYVVEKRPTRAA